MGAMKLIRITSETCNNCIIMKEMMRRVMPEFPEIEVIDLDKDLDEVEVKEINPEGKVPFLKLGNHTQLGTCKMDELRQFIREAIADN